MTFSPFPALEVEKKSYFVDSDDTLERRMELVNISLTVAGPYGVDMELRLNCEVLQDSTLVRRNQKPSSFIEEGGSWAKAVDAFFDRRLGLSREIRAELLEPQRLRNGRNDSLFLRLSQKNLVTDKASEAFETRAECHVS